MTITYKKDQIKRDMLIALSALEVTLVKHFAIRAIAETEEETREKAKKKMREIIGVSPSVIERYNAAVEWSEQIANQPDDFQKLKSEFGIYYRDHFTPQLKRDQKRCTEIINELKREADVLESELAIEKERAHLLADTEAAQFATLRKTAIGLTSVAIEPQMDNVVYQRSMTKLTARASANIPLLNPATAFKRRETPDFPLLTTRLKNFTLAELDKNIQAYQAQLDAESFFTKVARFFSPTRRKRQAAIAEYKKIQPGDGLARRYSAAESWLKTYGLTDEFTEDSTSRFYQTCVAPFNASYAQTYFSHLPVLQNDNKRLIGMVEDRIRGTIRAYNDQLSELNHQHKTRIKEHNHLQPQVAQLSAVINTIENTVAGGFVRSHAAESALAAAQETVITTLTNLSPTCAEANKITRDLLALPRHAQKEQVDALQLSARAKAIAHDQEAIMIIHKAIDKLISTTHSFGGKGNNAFYMGTAAAACVVAELGDEEQRKKFAKEAMRAAGQKKAREKINNAEKSIYLLDVLEPKLQDGTLQESLIKLRDVYDKHNKIDGQVPDKASEKAYYDKVKPLMRDAINMHESGNTRLKEFVQAAMTGIYNASFKRVNKPGDIYAQLSPDAVTTLALLFGTAAQLKHWQEKLLPAIQQNNGARDENDLVAPSLLSPKLKL
jgi:hypothetical protein